MTQPSLQEEAQFVHNKIDAMLTDQRIMGKAKRVAKQMEALMALPNVQEQVKVFAENVELSMKPVTENMEAMQAGDAKFQEAFEQMKVTFAKSMAEQMEALRSDPDSQKIAQTFASQMEPIFADDQTQNTQEDMIEKMIDRTLQTSSFENVNLEKAVLGKPAVQARNPSSSLAMQPRMGTKSFVAPPSVRASALPAPTPFQVRASSFFPNKKARQAAVERPQRVPVPRRGQPVPQPEEDDEFITPELQENINEAAYLVMRLAVASVMIHHGQEKILSAEAFTKFAIDKYFAFLPGPHIFWAYSAGAAQALGPIGVSLGIFSRIGAAACAGTMVGAFYYSVVTTGWEGFPLSKMAGRVPVFHNYGFETPVLYFAIFLSSTIMALRHLFSTS